MIITNGLLDPLLQQKLLALRPLPTLTQLLTRVELTRVQFKIRLNPLQLLDLLASPDLKGDVLASGTVPRIDLPALNALLPRKEAVRGLGSLPHRRTLAGNADKPNTKRIRNASRSNLRVVGAIDLATGRQSVQEEKPATLVSTLSASITSPPQHGDRTTDIQVQTVHGGTKDSARKPR
ncbi:unnamed protein product [Sphagnum tenellum]